MHFRTKQYLVFILLQVPSGLMVQSEFILILDDRETVTDTARFLREQGLNVRAFTDPFAALEDFEQNFNDYFLVLSGIRMPSMNGFHFVRKIRELKPELKVIFMTAFEIDISDFQKINPSMKVYGVIKKPIVMRKLGNLIKNSMAATLTMTKYEEKGERSLDRSVMTS
jgi:DNA-binding NtrC family response regulator